MSEQVPEPREREMPVTPTVEHRDNPRAAKHEVCGFALNSFACRRYHATP